MLIVLYLLSIVPAQALLSLLRLQQLGIAQVHLVTFWGLGLYELRNV